jgi:hypothetical protein
MHLLVLSKGDLITVSGKQESPVMVFYDISQGQSNVK